MSDLNQNEIEFVRHAILAQIGPEKYNTLVRQYPEAMERKKLRFWQQQLFDDHLQQSSLRIDAFQLYQQAFAGAEPVAVPEKTFVYPEAPHDALAFAVARSDLPKIRECFHRDANLPQTLATQKLPTWIMCEAGKHASPETVRLLAELGCDINQTDSNEFTGLCWAVASGRYHVAQTFLELGADVNKGLPLFTLCALNTASVTIAKLLIQHGADPHQTRQINDLPVDLVSRSLFFGNHELADYFRGLGVQIQKP